LIPISSPKLVGQGYTSAEIERLLGISANTVNTHIALAVQKLGAPCRDPQPYRRQANPCIDQVALWVGLLAQPHKP
jgi:predicted transcriptional regulator